MFNINSIPGWTTVCLQRCLFRAAQRWPSGAFLEVGSYYGASAICLAQLCLLQGGWPIITCVDAWADTPDSDCGDIYRPDMLRAGGDLLPAFIDNVVRAGVRPHIVARRGLSDQILPMLSGPFDAVLVDGGHSHDTALHDLRAGWKLLKRGGLLVAHDYWTDQVHCERPVVGMFPGVRRAVGDFVAETGQLFERDEITVWWTK